MLKLFRKARLVNAFVWLPVVQTLAILVYMLVSHQLYMATYLHSRSLWEAKLAEIGYAAITQNPEPMLKWHGVQTAEELSVVRDALSKKSAVQADSFDGAATRYTYLGGFFLSLFLASTMLFVFGAWKLEKRTRWPGASK